MAALGPVPPACAVAVSGGPDSMALALLVQGWAPGLLALTVDHGLRPDSAAEAAQVHEWLAARGIAHEVLRWHGPKPRANRQAAVREARYRLLAARCATDGIRHLLIAHHLEDQAETVLLRLGRGSGVDGLAGMAPMQEAFGLTLLRPLLEVPRARLAATLRAAGQDWIEDPSNGDPAYQRTRVRQALALLAPEGAAARHIAATAANLARARAALEQAADALALRALRPCGEGALWLDPAQLAAAPDEIGLRVLARALMRVGGEPLPPRLERLRRLHRALVAGTLGRGRTLHRCQLRAAEGAVLVAREGADRRRGPALFRSGHALFRDS